jgi:hypothetical protein
MQNPQTMEKLARLRKGLSVFDLIEKEPKPKQARRAAPERATGAK